MPAAYLNNFESSTTNSLPSGWQGFASPSGTIGNALVTELNPIFGSKSLAFADAQDAMAERYTAITAQDHGILYAQRFRKYTNGNTVQAGSLVGTNGSGGYICFCDLNNDRLGIFSAPNYSILTSTAHGTLSGIIGRSLSDSDILWYRAERLGSLNNGTIRFKAWLHGNEEPVAWAITASATGSTAAANCGFRLIGSTASGDSLMLDAVQIYDYTQLNPAVAIVLTISDTTASLYAPGASGGAGPYTYQWQRGFHGGPVTPINGAVSLLLRDSGLTSGTQYDYVLVAKDSTGTEVTSPTLTTMTTGISPATISSVTVSPSALTLLGGSNQQFTATVSGINNPSQVVTWLSSSGTITANGLLTAPPTQDSPQTIKVTATSTINSEKVGTATVTVTGTIPPKIGPINVFSVNGLDYIQYDKPIAGTRSILSVSLLVGTTAGGQSAIPAAMNLGNGGGQFVHPSGGYRYTVVATDIGSPPLSSAPSNEVLGINAPRGLPTTFVQTIAVVQNVLSTFFPPDVLLGLAKLKADTLDVNIKKVAGSDQAATNLRDTELNPTFSQSALDAFETVTSTQLQAKIDATFPPDLLAGLAKLKANTLDANIVTIAGSTDAAIHLRDDELSQSLPIAAATAIGAATAAKLAIPSVGDAATAVWSYKSRTLTTNTQS